MMSNHAYVIENDVLAGDEAEEISSVRLTALIHSVLEAGVRIDEPDLASSSGAPIPIYARPNNVAGAEPCDLSRCYFLGIQLAGGLLESATWEEEMRDAGASDIALDQCRRFLASHAE